MEALCRARKMELLRHSDEVSEMPQFHDQLPTSSL
jgi:hypothetical protein